MNTDTKEPPPCALLTKNFSVSGNQQEILARYKPFMILSVQSNWDTNVAHLIMQGRVGFFRLAPRFRITAKADEQGESTNITLHVSPNLSFWFVLLFCAAAMVFALQAVCSSVMRGETVRFVLLLAPLAMIILDVVELRWQAEYCMDRLRKVAMEQ